MEENVILIAPYRPVLQPLLDIMVIKDRALASIANGKTLRSHINAT